MSFERQVVFWFAALAALVFCLWTLGDILLPFVVGMALAYLFAPVANRLERYGMPRMVAACLIIGVFVLAFVVLALVFAPIIGGQLASFIQNVPGYVQRLQTLLADSNSPWLRRIGAEGLMDDKAIGDLVSQGMGWLTTFIRSLWSGGRTLISIFSLAVVTPVVAFYLICDWARMLKAIDGWVPLPHRGTVRQLGREIDAAIAGFVRGQTAVCLLLGSFYAVSLSFAGLNFGLLIGLVSGIISFIPYVGSMTGLVLSLGVAVAQFWPDWSAILLVFGIFMVGQFIEGNVLAPKLVGESVGLHPVWVIFAMFAFGYLFGFVGLLLAVPLAAAIRVIASFSLRRYQQSPLYTGDRS
ncbi:MAG: AI-2E family transporter [Rhizobiales bacterium]|nr:AI-2E family transporter [Hyphomicrobiales bacterium]